MNGTRSHDPEDREHPDSADQIREVLIHGNYMSQRDIDICLGFGLETLADYDDFENIRTLHEALAKDHKAGDASGAA